MEKKDHSNQKGAKEIHSKIYKSYRVPDEKMFNDTAYVHDQLDRLFFAMEAFREGDISVRLNKERNDKFADLAEAYNSMVEMIGGVSNEISRISRVGGVEGNLDARAEFKQAKGIWADLIENINILIEAIAKPVLEVSRILNNIAAGKLDDRFGLTVTGDFRSMAEVINRTLYSLNVFAEQVTLVAREVGVEGKLGGQASVPNIAGTWKNLTDNVNMMAANLTLHVREIAKVTTAVADGDLSGKISEEGKGGELLRLSRTINRMVDSLNIFSSEVNNVAREVGIEGKLGGQANVPNVAGVWKELTNNVNMMAGNLTVHVRNIASVSAAVASGDLSKKVTSEVRGEFVELKNSINQMVDFLSIIGSELTKVTREIGVEGKLGKQANVPDVKGSWKELIDNVNQMLGYYTSQVREIAKVTTAVANGDLSKQMDDKGTSGEVLDLYITVNRMVDSLNVFASEVTRVSREVGTEGELGGQAHVPDVAGVWSDLTNNVNTMAANLTSQVREIAAVSKAVANGDLSRKINIKSQGEIAALSENINKMVDSLNIFSAEVTRVTSEVGNEGKLGGQAVVPSVGGIWKKLTENVNRMISNLTGQVREIAVVAGAVAKGDLTQKITVDARGEIAGLKNTINQMVDSLNVFSDEVTKVAREVGIEGKLGGQAIVPIAAGSWKRLTDNVNLMADNLSSQVREIAKVSSALANGDFSSKIEGESRGEILELKNNINSMVDSFINIVNSANTIANGDFSVEMPIRSEVDKFKYHDK